VDSNPGTWNPESNDQPLCYQRWSCLRNALKKKYKFRLTTKSILIQKFLSFFSLKVEQKYFVKKMKTKRSLKEAKILIDVLTQQKNIVPK
jgi:hypothetical protein